VQEAVLYLLLPLLTGAGGGFAAGARGGRWREALLLMWLALPLILYTVFMALTPASEGGFWPWWLAGIFFLILPLFGWIIGATVAFAEASRRLPRDGA
jgi:hypothetical protein